MIAKKAMEQKDIYITDFDLRRLISHIEESKMSTRRDRNHIEQLESELKRARVVDSKDVPDDVITMNSMVRIEDVDSGKVMTLTLTFPADADIEKGKVSILAPIGTAMLGYRVNDTIEWEVPDGLRRLKVLDIVYQPERAGDYHL